ncbi:ABC transporter permease [Sphingorhabdus lutea]|uniref:ABC transporter permease n=1 Tax=Sphingorhabdus lutea TaxID=1913578 RepID=A0A1L3J9A2_9SPHN|nr:ABC transporter permease [Sphingorhabdus lutea]APG61695.1 ABC transporter permease [Sphingorhabdus lutea]
MKEVIRAAWVIGRRDFTAIIFSKAFIFFLLGPLFPLLIGFAAGGLGKQIAQERDVPVIGVLMDDVDSAKLQDARAELTAIMGEGRFAEFYILDVNQGNPQDPKSYLANKQPSLSAILSGSLDAPILTGTTAQAERWKGSMGLITAQAMNSQRLAAPQISMNLVQQSAGDAKELRLLTAQAAQTLLFMLTMLLAGMVLSNLVEEKSNKIIEILAASIPIDSVFLGKLFAMLAMAALGIIVWASVAIAGMEIFGNGLPAFSAPAVGWPLFITLGIIYFAMAYLMLGSLFLGIGSMAATVREVQTLSMPATMMQLLFFFLAMYSVTKINQPIEQFASIFPFTSPFAMLARAAQDETLWHHGVAIFGQAMFAILVLRIGVVLFRRNVMKSGSGKKLDDERRKLFGLIPLPQR